ncbi:hypothetical protein FUA48_15540 [Flavobacterium alkalisoli]|uniref:Uncharacterized protein n=1 Tax=Flavobacterium alkalisoli TaxID=2602769 RepID=A0A5B9FYN7_9FLAO|nr:hypothetical protein [Flavobacterium alkalisoli]QEE50938.1 hypothetical protein FUA48_15540 [Flavobacterium alkalisoli]
MRIKELHLDNKDVEQFGLKDFKSSKFSSVIALVGKNGSGKSRYLKAIENKIKNYDITSELNKKFDYLSSDLDEIQSHYTNHYNVYLAYQELQEAKKSKNVTKISDKANLFTIACNKLPRGLRPTEKTISERIDKINKEITQHLKIINPSDLRRLQKSFDNTNKKKVLFQDIIDSVIEIG